MKSELLYFGTNSPGGPVMPVQWAEFLETVVTPRFPDGLSVWPASGQWRNAAGAVEREATYVLNIVHTNLAAEQRSLQDIIETYQGRFRQEAVLRVQSDVCANI